MASEVVFKAITQSLLIIIQTLPTVSALVEDPVGLNWKMLFVSMDKILQFLLPRNQSRREEEQDK